MPQCRHSRPKSAVIARRLPSICFPLPSDKSFKVDAPHLLFSIRKSEVAERNFKLSRPTFAINICFNPPNSLPCEIYFGIIVAIIIIFHAPRCADKLISSAMVVIWVNKERYNIRIESITTAPSNPIYNFMGLGIVTSESNVQMMLIIKNINDCFFRSRFIWRILPNKATNR